MGKKLHCMLCGKEKFHDEALPEQEFYLCWNCSMFWFADSLRRFGARVSAWWPWKRR